MVGRAKSSGPSRCAEAPWLAASLRSLHLLPHIRCFQRLDVPTSSLLRWVRYVFLGRVESVTRGSHLLVPFVLAISGQYRHGVPAQNGMICKMLLLQIQIDSYAKGSSVGWSLKPDHSPLLSNRRNIKPPIPLPDEVPSPAGGRAFKPTFETGFRNRQCS